MSARANYSDQLRHPLWQKRRLEVLQAAQWKCIDCDDGERTLNVHHLKYRRGAKPWESPDHDLAVLCEDCHLIRHLRESAKSADAEKSLEEAINEAAIMLVETPSRETRISAARVMAHLIRARSPEQVARMEIAKGLR